jgi:hypothetical protein
MAVAVQARSPVSMRGAGQEGERDGAIGVERQKQQQGQRRHDSREGRSGGEGGALLRTVGAKTAER